MSLGEAERAVILTDPGKEEEDALSVKAVFGFEPEEVWSGRVASRTLFRRVLRDGKPTLLADAREDVLHKNRHSVQAAELVSVLALPFRSAGRVEGLLYVDSRMKAGNFERDHLERAQQFAEAFGRRWGELPALDFDDESLLPPRPEEYKLHVEPEPPGAQSRFWLSTGAFCLTLLLIFFGAPPVAEMPIQETATPIARPNIEERPLGLAVTFVQHLQDDQLEQAQSIMSDSLARSLGAEGLQRVAARLGPETRVLTERVEGDKAIVTVAGPEGKSWSWHFAREADDWKLSRFPHGFNTAAHK